MWDAKRPHRQKNKNKNVGVWVANKPTKSTNVRVQETARSQTPNHGIVGFSQAHSNENVGMWQLRLNVTCGMPIGSGLDEKY